MEKPWKMEKLTVHQAAILLGEPDQTIRKAIESGEVPGYVGQKIGRKYLIFKRGFYEYYHIPAYVKPWKSTC